MYSYNPTTCRRVDSRLRRVEEEADGYVGLITNTVFASRLVPAVSGVDRLQVLTKHDSITKREML